MDKKLIYYIIRVSKEESSFLYFLLEGHDNLCFYSTLYYQTGQQYRDIELTASMELSNELEHFITQISKKFSVEILQKEIISDSNSRTIT